ncbi:hypothetical protein SAMN06265337_3903 [Hymenobacter gelipurpurascens]|uniref:Lipocalin-like domain-containing protein n=1 Tax=Hymenobacter gelipurpurascens TaxID=89968 RepID=A0A212UGM1_9BACT|nr:hypothetical protein [Hymenobacter gelipurpurascens]SNC77320.1 hypothetical protein SAMN06265337_3903 [Hymenobacter gelipurpurascens]
MKSILKLLLVTTLGLSACSKDHTPPKDSKIALQGTSWRMTAYSVETKPLTGTGSRIYDFFRSYSQYAPVPCLGLNTLTFASSGELLWTQEAGGCTVGISQNPQGGAISTWGKWRLNDAKTQLTVDTEFAAPGSSMLPVMYAASGAYEVIQVDKSALILSSKHIIGRQKDSLLIERTVFAPL